MYPPPFSRCESCDVRSPLPLVAPAHTADGGKKSWRLHPERFLVLEVYTLGLAFSLKAHCSQSRPFC